MRGDRRIGALGVGLALLGAGWALAALAPVAAQGARPWVDPPANLKQPASPEPAREPAPKAEMSSVAPAKAADTAPEKPALPVRAADTAPEKPASPDKPILAEKPAEPAKAAVARPARPDRVTRSPRQAARTETARQRSAIQTERAQRRAVANREPGREAAPEASPARSRELQVMRLRTLEYPDGRRVEVLTPIEPEPDFGWPFR
jgi:hypothetical protein